MQIERISINLLKPYENNAKIHTPEQVQQIIKSIEEFGFNDPIAVDENNMVIEGHGRLLALQELGWTEVEAIRLAGLTEEQKHAYIHVHNQLTMSTGFDLDILEAELRSITGIDMGAFGFDMDFEIEMNPEDFDDPPEDVKPVSEPRCKRGQIYQCGDHRIMCGDSTKSADVTRLTEGKMMDLLITDPPYGVSYQCNDSASEDRARKRNKTVMSIVNDDLDADGLYNLLIDSISEAVRVLKPGGVFYIWHAGSNSPIFLQAVSELGLRIRQILVWVKNIAAFGRQDYQWKHEPVIYGWTDGGPHYFINDRCQTTIFEDRPDFESMDRDQLLKTVKFLQAALEQSASSVLHENKPSRNAIHPTMKPVPLLQRLIQNSSRRGENVLDLFGGSGSTMIACENCGRRAYLMEIDPQYCDAAITRWEEETGKKAVLINDR